MARRTASRSASSRSSGPNRSGFCVTSSQNFTYQPGNDQLPMTVAGMIGKCSPHAPREDMSSRGGDDYTMPRAIVNLSLRRTTTTNPCGIPMNDFSTDRSQFPGLHQRPGTIFLDGPAGTQVPQRVIDA